MGADKKITPIAKIAVKRPSKKQTVVISQLQPDRIQAAIIGVFKKYDYEPIDLEALIYFTMQKFEVSIHSHESIYKVIRSHIFSNNFTITQGRHLSMSDIYMRRILVSYNVETE